MAQDPDATRRQARAKPTDMSELAHAFRASAFSAERHYRLGPDALEWKDDRQAGQIAYRDVVKVSISNVPTLGQTQYRCMLRSAAGQKAALTSASYKRFGVIEDRSASYVPLVRELLLRIAAANPKASFSAGQGFGLWLFWLIILVLAALILAGGLILTVMGQVPMAATGSFVVLAIMLPIGWRVVRHGPPRSVDPRTPPPEDLSG
jgi:hypothetical protein